MFKTIKEAINWLEHKQQKTDFNYFKNVYQELIHTDIPIIHVTGTNGKGSTVNYIRSALETSGYKVGTFTSPYLYVHNDRIRINDQMIDDDSLLRLINEVSIDPVIKELSMFEIDFIIAMRYFIMNNVEAIILEVGIGGRYDCTNVVTPIVSVITSIALDHQFLLGDTIDLIAYQKAGIIKQTIPIVIGRLGEISKSVINEEAKLLDAHLVEVKTIRNGGLSMFDYQQFKNIELKSEAYYQKENAAVAIETCMLIKKRFPNMQDYLIQKGIEKAFWEGRMEEVLPNVYVDGAHNMAALQNLIFSLKQLRKGPIEMIYASLKRPDLDELLAYGSSQVDLFKITSFEDFRIADMGKYENEYEYVDDFTELIKSPAEGIRVFTGSLHFVSKIKQILKNRA